MPTVDMRDMDTSAEGKEVLLTVLMPAVRGRSEHARNLRHTGGEVPRLLAGLGIQTLANLAVEA